MNTKYFEDNDFLKSYVELIISNMDTPKKRFFTESHHIIQKAYFKDIGIKDNSIINSSDNLVNLTYRDHILAHYYLYHCSINEHIKQSNLIALINMTNEKKHLDDIEGLIKELDLYENMRREWLLWLSNKTKGTKNPKISKWLRENHFDCSDENNSMAREVFVYDINTGCLITKYGAQCVASRELDIPHIKEKLNKSKFGVFIMDDKVISKKFPFDRNSVENELKYRDNLKSKTRKDRVFKCKICGNPYIKKLNDYDYEIYLEKYNHTDLGRCGTCGINGSYFKNRPKSSEHRLKISESAKGRHWINNGVLQKQVHDDIIEKYFENGWSKGKLYKDDARSKQ